jgi:hypothetical protein
MKYRITIPEPCHEDWGKMTPTEKGRFCAVCQKNLVDFTTYSTRQLFAEVSAGKNICGRFREDQLNRFIYEQPPKKSGAFQLAITSVLALFVANSANGSQLSNSAFPFNIVETQAISKNITTNEYLKITGVVIDKDGNLVSNVTVYIDELPYESITDSLGRFHILIRERVYLDSITLSVMHLHAKGQIRVSANSLKKGEAVKITVAPSRFQEQYTIDQPTAKETTYPTFQLGGICVQKQTFWQRIGTWFRRVF